MLGRSSPGGGRKANAGVAWRDWLAARSSGGREGPLDGRVAVCGETISGIARPSGAAVSLLRRAGLRPEGPVPWGSPPATRAPGIYVLELPAPRPAAPLDISAIAAWRRRVPTITVDGRTATAAAIAERLAAFWIPSATVLYIGQASGTVRNRVGAYYRTPLGDRSPHAGGHWVKTLSALAECVLWSAATDDYDAAERELIEDFARTVPAVEAAALQDPFLVLPFANLRDGDRRKKAHGIGSSKLPRR